MYLTPDEVYDLSDYETKDDAQAKLAEANTYADTVGESIKNDLLNGASEAYNTLKELGDLIDENVDAIDALETVAANKADKEHGHNVATQSESGFMSSADKVKLDGIAPDANAYTHPSYTARTGVPSQNQAPGFGGTFNVTQPVSDASGHITAMNSRTITIPNATATTSTAGLMSVADKVKMNAYAPTSIIVHNSTTNLPAVVNGALLIAYDA